jgi:hypothetical protein
MYNPYPPKWQVNSVLLAVFSSILCFLPSPESGVMKYSIWFYLHLAVAFSGLPDPGRTWLGPGNIQRDLCLADPQISL